MTAAITRVGVVGSGLMGTGIAEVCAKAGLDVRVAVSRPASLETGRRRVVGSLDRAVRKGKVTERERDEALGRIAFTTDLVDLGDRQLVIESVKEDEATKADVFAALSKIVEDPEAILATNTSSLPIMRLARATDRPEHVMGIHFFSPAPVLPLVELITSLHTADDVTDRAEEFVTGTLGKVPVRSHDRTGFVVNALLVPYLLAAVRMLESGFATAEVIDRAMILGCSHPMGPLQLADLIGLDVVASVGDALYEEFKEPLYAPPPLLVRMVEGGFLGRKSGRGFHTYG
ncbi:3-hydroxybutyryl-CoA dehydrogenase [Streptomyces sp. P6-2-1]|uniref:3-hydroxybutyryl-CoA dehydrogenase n=1 Tax=unclassified Streptomyces TaxID=2593676 RepID=UPI003D359E2F